MKDYIDTYRKKQSEQSVAWKEFAKQAKLDVARAKLKGLIKQG